MSEPITHIQIIRPGDISPRVFDFYTNLEFPDQLSSTAARLGNADTGDWRFVWFLDTPITAADVLMHLSIMGAACDVDDVAVLSTKDITLIALDRDTNWLTESYRGFPPFTIARFFLHGLHDADVPLPDGYIGILIDAATAFGSGEHPTTRGCMEWIDALAADGVTPHRILDLGTGSGILAIAAHKTWRVPIIAVDNDMESVRVAAEYRDLNTIAPDDMICLHADTPADKHVAAHGPYDLVLANILAGPLRDLAPAIAAAQRDGPATLVLSGLLETQIDDVMAAYTPLGYKLAGQKIITDWAALLLTRK